MAVAVELFHNAFLVHDDIQDGSLRRRGGPTLHEAHGVGVAVNVGNATNLLALERVLASRSSLGATASWALAQETQRMMRHSLEGQAIELGWIRDNVCELRPRDYLRMCLKKTSWYSFIYPMRVGALVASGALRTSELFCRLGWYLGAAFQIQDDLLNLVGDYRRYGKEIGGDLREGKRTMMLVHLLDRCARKERRALKRFFRGTRAEREGADVAWIQQLMVEHGSIVFAKTAARRLAREALKEVTRELRDVPDSTHARFIKQMASYVVERDR
jgi:geranylgeranyl diphosphate synthase type II